MAVERISVELWTVISAICPDKPIFWNLPEHGPVPDFWEPSDIQKFQKISKKKEFLRAMVGYDKLDDKQLARAAALCRDHVLYQFPVFKELINKPEEISTSKCMAMERTLGKEIKVIPLPPGVYKLLPGCLEHQFKSCQTVEEVLALNEEIMARYAEPTSQEG